MYGPAVRCKPNVKKWRGLVLRICIRPLHGAVMLLAIMDIRAHPISFCARPRAATVRGRPGTDQRNPGANWPIAGTNGVMVLNKYWKFFQGKARRA